MTSIESITSFEAVQFLQDLTGADPLHGEAVAELARHVISSRKRSGFHRLFRDIATLMSPVREVTPEEMRVVIEALEADGDIIINHGIVWVTPIRAIQLDELIFKFMSSLPTKRLIDLFPGDWSCHESTRTCKSLQPWSMADQITANGGILLSAEGWAGLDREPAADALWLSTLEQQLIDHPNLPDSADLETGRHKREWEWLQADGSTLRWRRGEAPAGIRIWRALKFNGYMLYALTQSGSPAVQPWLRLRRDDAHRTIFALARTAKSNGWKIPVSISDRPDGAVLTIPPILPYAEYRYLTVLAMSRASEQSSIRWQFSFTRLPRILEILDSRLGIQFKH